MSRVDDLIAEHAPEGVAFRTLGDIARFVRGNGMPKTQLVDEGVGAIHYGQIYTKYGVWATKTISFVTPEAAEKLAKAQPGDIIITNTSENVEDVGKAVAWLGSEPIVTGGHATVIQHDLDPKYLAYWFQSDSFFAQKRALATGTKVIDVSAKQLSKVRIPVPPLAVQQEIATTLDRFGQLQERLDAALDSELEARRLQYTYYSDALLSFDTLIRRIPLGELGAIFGGLTGKSKDDFSDGNARFASYKNVFANSALDLDANDYVKVGPNERQRALAYGDVLFTGSSESLEEVGMASVVTKLPSEPIYLNSFCIGFRPHDVSQLEPEFAKHLFRSGVMRSQIIKTANGVTRINVSKARLAKILVPVPSLSEQRRIASILDRFEALASDLSICLPAERAARRKQYEFYRSKLLTFEEAAA